MENIIPLRLLPARAWRTYVGGRRIAALHGETSPKDNHYPEEWLFSIIEARNSNCPEQPEGLSLIANSGISLLEYIKSNPEVALGTKHLSTWGITTGVLLKLIDAAERLTIQVHPSKEMAQKLFHSPFGKTECWHFLENQKVNGHSPYFYLGFKPGITQEYWQHLFEQQDITGMLQCLHQFEAKAGQTVLIEGGVPHAIGEGCFLMEIQEPTDYTIRTERVTPAGLHIADEMCHQGLGFSKMMNCFSYRGFSRDEAMRRWSIPPQTISYGNNSCTILIDAKHTNCFSLERWEIVQPITFHNEGRFSGLYILAGSGCLQVNHICEKLLPGNSFFIPAACQPFSLHCEKPLVLFRCFGPDIPENPI